MIDIKDGYILRQDYNKIKTAVETISELLYPPDSGKIENGIEYVPLIVVPKFDDIIEASATLCDFINCWTLKDDNENDEEIDVVYKTPIVSDKCLTSKQFVIQYCNIPDSENIGEIPWDEFESLYPNNWTFCLSDIDEINKDVVLVRFKDDVYRFVEIESDPV